MPTYEINPAGVRVAVLSFAEATHPRILAMYGGDHCKGSDPSVMLLKFPNMHSAASWASTSDLENETHYAGDRLGCGPSFGDWTMVEVMVPDQI